MRDKDQKWWTFGLQDWLLHFIAGSIIYLAAFLISKSISIGLIAAIVVGSLKEAYDFFDYGKFNFKDLSWTIVGGLVCCGLIELF